MTVRVRFAPSPTGDLHIGGAFNRDKRIETPQHACADFTVIVRPPGNGDALDAIFIAPLPNAGQRLGDRMSAEIGGEPRNANPVVPVSLTTPERFLGGRMFYGGPDFGTALLVLRR